MVEQDFRGDAGAGPDWLGMAIDLARDNVASGGRPFGAVIVRDGVLLATGVNEVLATNDPTAHAEIKAISAACRFLRDASLSGATLYSSCEPCPMCIAATLWAGLAAVVYGADNDVAQKAGFEDKELYHLLDQPRETWPMTVRQQDHGLADSPFRAWTDSR